MSEYEDDEQSGLVRAYRFVPLPDSSVPTRDIPGHHRFRPDGYSGTLQARIVAISPVHIASGLLEQRTDRRYPLIKAHFRANGEIAIPGTSLKGCVRNVAEAISNAFVQVTRAREIDRRYLPSRQNRQQRLDSVQRIFGAFGYQGALSFADAIIVPSDTPPEIHLAPQLFAPRTQSPHTYFDGSRPKGRKFYFHGPIITGDTPIEVCPAGSQFNLLLRFSDLTRADLGLVLAAMGLSNQAEERFRLKIGGGKPAGLGSIEISAPTLSAQRGTQRYTDPDAAPEQLPIEALIAEARRAGLVLPERVRLLQGAMEE